MRNRRRILIVNGPVQARLVMRTSVVPVAILIVFGLAAFGQSWLSESGSAVRLPPWAWLGLALAASGAVLVQALRVSHLIAGPQHTIVRALRRIRENEAGFRIRLRHGDELNEIVDELNGVLEWLKQNSASSKTAELPQPRDEQDVSPPGAELVEAR